MKTWVLLLVWAEWAAGEECHAYLEQNTPFGSLHLALDYEPLPALVVRLTAPDCAQAPVYSPLLAVDGQPSAAALPWTTDCGRYRSWRLERSPVTACQPCRSKHSDTACCPQKNSTISFFRWCR